MRKVQGIWLKNVESQNICSLVTLESAWTTYWQIIHTDVKKILWKQKRSNSICQIKPKSSNMEEEKSKEFEMNVPIKRSIEGEII